MRLMYITNSTFPSSTAHSARVNAICKAISFGSEIEVQVLAARPPNGGHGLISSDFPVDYFGIAVKGPFTNLVSMFFSWFFLLSALFFKKKPDAIVFTAAYARMSVAVFLYAKIFGVKKIIAEVCEWYEDSQIPLGRLGPIYWANKWSRESFINFSSAFIVISTLLEEFYKKYKKPVIRIPAIVDFEPNSAAVSGDGKVKFAYAGHPGKNKDQIGLMLEAYLGDKEIYKNSRLVLIGLSESGLNELLSKYQLNFPDEASILACGSVSQSRARCIVKECDYTILLRNNSLNANAGFPTKVSESLSLGVPIICNETSDIFFYAEHLVTGIRVAGSSASDLASAMCLALSLSVAERELMKDRAIDLANDNFFWKPYCRELQDLVLHTS